MRVPARILANRRPFVFCREPLSGGEISERVARARTHAAAPPCGGDALLPHAPALSAPRGRARDEGDPRDHLRSRERQGHQGALPRSLQSRRADEPRPGGRPVRGAAPTSSSPSTPAATSPICWSSSSTPSRSSSLASKAMGGRSSYAEAVQCHWGVPHLHARFASAPMTGSTGAVATWVSDRPSREGARWGARQRHAFVPRCGREIGIAGASGSDGSASRPS